MSDPAVEAAQRVCPASDSPTSLTINRVAEYGAREALKPIRELHGWWSSEGVLPPEAWQILDQLAPLIYTTEELER